MTQAKLERAHASLLDHVGRHGHQTKATVTRRDIARFALAAGDASPIYVSDDAARVAGYAGIVAHPLMLSSTLEWGNGCRADELRSDGTGTGGEGWLPLDGLRIMGGGQDLQLHAPIHPGETFIAEPELTAVELKHGESGDLLLLTITTEYMNADSGERLLTCRETLIVR